MDGPNPVQNELSRPSLLSKHPLWYNQPSIKKKGLTPKALNQKKSVSLNNFQKQQANKLPSRG